MNFRIACHSAEQGKVPYSVLSQDTIEWRKKVLNQDHVDHKHSALTTRNCSFCFLTTIKNLNKEKSLYNQKGYGKKNTVYKSY